ncbi:MAG: hypothetical protein QG675_186 [Patescibacteria group bacterium]|jgi:probable phosphoglycerate mutase|nr:hypothetical protein [Patescibacteria group bacterium]
MKLYVVRHGQTNYNELGLCNSDPKVDVHLTRVGIEQAKKLASKLKSTDIEQVYVSELKRTIQTAQIVNKFHNAPIVIDARLNDIRFGYEGKHYSEYHAALDRAGDKWTARFNGGESITDLRERTQDFLNDLKIQDHRSVLIVTSGGIIQAMYGILGNHAIEESWDFRPDKGSCVEFDI